MLPSMICIQQATEPSSATIPEEFTTFWNSGGVCDDPVVAHVRPRSSSHRPAK